MTMGVLVAGGLLVAGLMVWALTRTVDTSTVTSTTASPVINPGPANTGTAATASDAAAQKAYLDEEEKKKEIPRIAIEDLKSMWARKGVTVIDVRHKDQFEGGHIPGALNIPLASVQTELSTIPKDKPIVTYCT